MAKKLKPKHKPLVAKRQPPRWQRERNISLLVWLILPLVIALAVGLVGYWAYDSYVAVWHKPIAEVNGTVVDMSHFVKMLRFSAKASGQQVDATLLPDEVLRQIEDRELIAQKASTVGVDIPPDRITEQISEYLGAGQGNMTQAEQDELYQQWLDYVELSDSEYRGLVEGDLLRSELIEYFKEHQVPEEGKHVHLHTLLRATEEEALSALEQFNSGNVTVAEEFTLGDKGWVPEGIYPQFDEAAFSLAAGNVTGPIVTGQGYYLIKVSEVAESMALDDGHRETLAYRAFDSWLQEERASGAIKEYMDSDKAKWAIQHI